MSRVVDCRGLACPEPVLLARQALQEAGGGSVMVLVSSSVARDNVTRAARQMGWTSAVEEDGVGFRLKLERIN
ncbi:MAG: sulfurtransferase TusA family protein [Bacillota bacterium]